MIVDKQTTFHLSGFVLDEAVALVFARHAGLCQLAVFDWPERLEYRLDVVLRQVRVDGGDVNAVVVLGLLDDLVDDLLGLGHIRGPAHLDVAAGDDDPVHLLQGQLGSLGHLVLDESETLVFLQKNNNN